MDMCWGYDTKHSIECLHCLLARFHVTPFRAAVYSPNNLHATLTLTATGSWVGVRGDWGPGGPPGRGAGEGRRRFAGEEAGGGPGSRGRGPRETSGRPPRPLSGETLN